MALVNANAEFRDFERNPIPMPAEGEAEARTLRLKDVCAQALTALDPDDNASGDEKFKNWRLAQRIWDAEGEVNLNAGEIDKIKKLIGKLYGSTIVGQAWELLDPSGEKPDGDAES